MGQHTPLAEELVFRGGTCLHQVHLPEPLRYSEDLDFVRRTHSEIGPVLDALREVAATVGLRVKGTDVRKYPKVRMQADAEESGVKINIKIEINTDETSSAGGVIKAPFEVANSWFTAFVGKEAWRNL